MNLTVLKVINALASLPKFSGISISGSVFIMRFSSFKINIWLCKNKQLYSIRLSKEMTLKCDFWVGRAQNYNGTESYHSPFTTKNCKKYNDYIVAIDGRPVNGELHRQTRLLDDDIAAALNAVCLALGIKD